MQRDPEWRPPCIICGKLLERTYTGGRRLCPTCLKEKYSPLEYRARGGRRLKLKPCKECGGPKQRFNISRYCSTCQQKWKGLPLTASNREYGRGRDLYKKYGITVIQYDKMLAMHDGGCWICGNKPRTRRLAVEHDHGATNGINKRVRGLVCHVCNKHRIGVNTPETAKKVYEYLISEFDGREL